NPGADARVQWAYLGAHTELAAVHQPGRDVDEDGGRVYLAREAARVAEIPGDDRLREPRTMPADVLERRVEVVHDADREDQVEILRVPVRVGRGPSGGHEHPRRGTAAELDTRVGEEPPGERQEGRRDRAVG